MVRLHAVALVNDEVVSDISSSDQEVCPVDIDYRVACFEMTTRRTMVPVRVEREYERGILRTVRVLTQVGGDVKQVSMLLY